MGDERVWVPAGRFKVEGRTVERQGAYVFGVSRSRVRELARQMARQRMRTA